MFYNAGRRNTGCGCIAPLIGLLFIVVGIFIARDTLNFLPGTLSAQGVITECHIVTSDNENGSSCNPDVRFQTQDGRTISFRSSSSSSSYHTGDAVTVRYHAATPQDGRIDSFLETWLLPIVCIGMGLIAFLLGSLALLRGIIGRIMGVS